MSAGDFLLNPGELNLDSLPYSLSERERIWMIITLKKPQKIIVQVLKHTVFGVDRESTQDYIRFAQINILISTTRELT